jgi:ribose transport system permease protein
MDLSLRRRRGDVSLAPGPVAARIAVGHEISAADEAGFDREDAASALARERQLARRRRLLARLQGYALVVVLGVVGVIMWASSPYFLTSGNLITALFAVSILGIMAVLETLIVIAGEIDISIAGVVAFSSVLIGLLVADNWNVWLAAAVALAASGGVGLLNGVLTVYLKINSLVTTLATYSIFTGLAYVISGTATLSVGGSGFWELGSGRPLSIPAPVYFFVGIWVIVALVTRFTAFGRHIYATGDNYDAAVRSGVRADRLRVGLFVAVGLSAGVAGVITTSELYSGSPQVGDPYLLSVITAVILGGASLRGGRGTMLGTLVAVLILGVLINGFALLQFSSFAADIVLGILLLVAVLSDNLLRKAAQ